MQTSFKNYIFCAEPTAYAVSFKKKYGIQNLNILRLVATVACGISLLLLLSDLFVEYDAMLPLKTAYFYNCLTLCCGSAIVVPIAKILLNNYRKYAHLVQLVCLAYTVLFIGCCMAVSFFVQLNPKNNMTMYLLGVLLVAVLFVFSLKEVLILMLLVSILFTAGISLCSLPLEQELFNSIGSAFILTCFFVISRVVYSYRLNHHVQVKLIKAQQRQIQKISKAKSDILRIVAHDMRAPFANIEMLVTMLRKRKNMQPEQQEQLYGMIMTSCHKSKDLIHDLLELARLEQEQTFATQPTDMRAFLTEVQADWHQRLGNNKSLLFTFTDKACFVQLHRKKFQRVLDNLLSNAVKFTPDDGLVKVDVEESGQHIVVRISDNGIGIPKHLQLHLFKPFSKASRKGLKGEKSIGLGLHICQKLVEQHGGSIGVESEEQKGTTFFIKLPLIKNYKAA